MRAELQTILDDLGAARARWARLADATPDDRWAVRSRPDAWSVAENIAHLNLTARAMAPLLEAATSQARARGPYAGPLRRSFFGALLGRMVGPVPRFLGMRMGAVRTPPGFVPNALESRAAITAEFERQLVQHEAGIRGADGLAIHEVFVDSPFAPGTRYDALSGWTVVVRHLHRHLDQAERVWDA